jgi:hypothetical protein
MKIQAALWFFFLFFQKRNGGEYFKIISSSGSGTKESEVMRMYVTYQDLMMFAALIVEVIGLVIAILSFADNKKAITAYPRRFSGYCFF